ncbi:hypothetical protein [Pseudomonas sp. BMS12]|uniref:hypothetical protein n=1 Tax=Pseudomonas sp. BMS12 TaxID=1796033 RepID=UPI00083B7748|nr:hypothetical protein [Pseudomonas sp. BMS12]
MTDRREERLVYELSNCIARHADWLSGRDFQRIAERVARGYFAENDLDEYVTFEELQRAFDEAAKIAMEVVKDAQ